MRIVDLLELVRAGFKPAEIKEMIESDKNESENDIDSNIKHDEDDKDDEDSKDDKESKDDENKNVFKYEDELNAAKAEIESLKKTIADIQKENKSKDISDTSEKTLDEQIIDALNNLF